MDAEDEPEYATHVETGLYVVAAGLAALLVLRSLPERTNPGPPPAHRLHEPGRGRNAETPVQIPAKGWKDIILRTYQGISDHRVLALAAGSTYYALLAIFPGLAALVAIYGMFSDPSEIGRQLISLEGILPGGATVVIGEELTRLASQPRGTLSFALVGGLGVAIWSANSGVKALFDSLNQVYGESETRSFIRLTFLTLAFTFMSILFLVFAIGAVILLPVVLNTVGLPEGVAIASQLLRWPLLFILLSIGLAFVYRFGPNREKAQWKWVTGGSALASLVWLIASLLFSWYAGHYASFDRTYGSLGAVIGFMIWIWVSMIVVLVGAEFDAEMEHQTARDTTTGSPLPMGQRGADMADTIGRAKD